MTFDEKEAKLVELFNKLKEKETESKSVSNSIVELQNLKENIIVELENLKKKNKEAEGMIIGKGKYADAILAPTRLKSELDNLQNKSVNPYNGITNEAALKEYEGKKQVLMEDIELARINAELAVEEANNIAEAYNQARQNKILCNKMIRRNIKMLNLISKELKNINKQIKATDKIVVEEELGRTK